MACNGAEIKLTYIKSNSSQGTAEGWADNSMVLRFKWAPDDLEKLNKVIIQVPGDILSILVIDIWTEKALRDCTDCSL